MTSEDVMVILDVMEWSFKIILYLVAAPVIIDWAEYLISVYRRGKGRL